MSRHKNKGSHGRSVAAAPVTTAETSTPVRIPPPGYCVAFALTEAPGDEMALFTKPRVLGDIVIALRAYVVAHNQGSTNDTPLATTIRPILKGA